MSILSKLLPTVKVFMVLPKFTKKLNSLVSEKGLDTELSFHKTKVKTKRKKVYTV